MAIARIKTKFGDVFRADKCKSDYRTIVTSTWYRRKGVPFKKRPMAISLQKPAMQAFRAAEAKLGRQVFVTGSLRTCEFQAAKYAEDPKRFAHPDEGVHTQGLAVDLHTVKSGSPEVYAAFAAVGWKRSRPTDEPWHHSWGVSA